MALTTINATKELAVTYAPLSLVTITPKTGTPLRFATQGLNVAEGGVQYLGNDYICKLKLTDFSQIAALSETGVDLIPGATLTIVDVDGSIAKNFEQASGAGFKGSDIEIRVVFYDVIGKTFSSDYRTIFLGICELPEITESEIRVSAYSKLKLARTYLPPVAMQNRCAWMNPETVAQRLDADNSDSPYVECGETRSLAAAPPCSYTKATCTRPLRFSGRTWQGPESIRSREYTTGNWVNITLSKNEVVAGEYYPLLYGTGWVEPPTSVTGDANYTRGEAVLCVGDIRNIQRVVVNDVELAAATDMDGAPYSAANKEFRYNVINRGKRDGALNMDSPWNGTGDPYGSLAVIEWVVPARVADPKSAPKIKVLMDGVRSKIYKKIASAAGSGGVITVTLTGANSDVNDGTTVTITGSGLAAANGVWPAINGAWGPPGTFQLSGSVATGSGAGGYVSYDYFTTNPVWILLEMLTWGAYRTTDIDIDSFISAASVCDQVVTYTDENNVSGTRPRYSVSTLLRQRRPVSDIVRGIRQACNLMLVPSSTTGKLQAIIKQTLADQQPAPVAGSNYNTAIASKTAAGVVTNGYAAYRFDASTMLRRDRPSTFREVGRPTQDQPNRISLKFANSNNQYAESSLSYVDTADVARLSGQEVAGGLNVSPEGITTYDHAMKQARVLMAEALRGNEFNDTRGTRWFEFETTFRAIHLRIGDLVLVNNARRNIVNQVCRVAKIQPSSNFETEKLTVYWHNDDWYTDVYGAPGTLDVVGPQRLVPVRPPFSWLPNSAAPNTSNPVYSSTEKTFSITPVYEASADGSKIARLSVSGALPVNLASATATPPAVPSQANTASIGGALSAGSYFLALAATDASGAYSPISDMVRADITTAGAVNLATINGIRWQSGTVGWALFAGKSPLRLSLQKTGVGTPSSVALDTAYQVASSGAPDPVFDHLVLDISTASMSGCFIGKVTAVSTTTVTFTGPAWTVNSFAGYDISLLASAALTSTPVLDFRINSNTANVLTLATNPVAAGVGVGDWLVIRSKPTVSGTTLTDARLALAAAGEVGNTVLLIAGTGRGQRRRIVSNTATSVTVDSAWVTAPDTTTRWIIIDSVIASVPSKTQANLLASASLSVDAEVANYAGKVLVLAPRAASSDGVLDLEADAPIRDIYLVGQTGGASGMVDPVLPDSVVLSVSGGGTTSSTYSLSSVITLPAVLGSIKAMRRTVHFFTTAVIVNSESHKVLEELGTNLADVTPGDGPYATVSSDYWAEMWVTTFNGDLIESAPRKSNRVKINGDPNAGAGLDSTLADVTVDTSYSEAGWNGVGLLWQGSSVPGKVNLKARYTPPLSGIAPAITTPLQYVDAWVETDPDPLPSNVTPSAVRLYSTSPYNGNAQGDSQAVKGTVVAYDVDFTTAKMYFHLIGKSAKGTQPFKKVHSGAPPSVNRYLTIQLTGSNGDTVAPPTQPGTADWSVAVNNYSKGADGIQMGRVIITLPADAATTTGFYTAYSYLGSGAPSDPRLWVEFGGYTPGSKTELMQWVKRPDTADETYQIAIVKSNATSWTLPTDVGFTPTFKPVTITKWAYPAQVSGCSVVVGGVGNERETDLGTEFRTKFIFTAPTSDLNYWHTRIQGNWCTSSWVPGTQFDDDPGYAPITSPMYSDWILYPEATEYHQMRFCSEATGGQRVLTGAPVVNVTVPGKPRKINPKILDPAKLDPSISVNPSGVISVNSAVLTPDATKILNLGNGFANVGGLIQPKTGPDVILNADGTLSPTGTAIMAGLGVDNDTIKKIGGAIAHTKVTAAVLIAGLAIIDHAQIGSGTAKIYLNADGTANFQGGSGAQVVIDSTGVGVFNGTNKVLIGAGGVDIVGGGKTITMQSGNLQLSGATVEMSDVLINTSLNVNAILTATVTAVDVKKPLGVLAGFTQPSVVRAALLSPSGNPLKFIRANAGGTDWEWADVSAGGGTWGTITGTLASQTDLNTALSGKSNTGHTHASTDISGLGNAATKNVGASVGQVADGGHSHLGTYSPVAHLHTFVYADYSHTHSGVYAPVTHTHTGYANSTHSHATSDVTGLDTSFTWYNGRLDGHDTDIAAIYARLVAHGI